MSKNPRTLVYILRCDSCHAETAIVTTEVTTPADDYMVRETVRSDPRRKCSCGHIRDLVIAEDRRRNRPPLN